MKAILLSTVAIAALVTVADATTVIDQENLPSVNWGLNDSFEWQQEVTAGFSGQLAGVELFGTSPSDLVRIALGAAFSGVPFVFSHRQLLSAVQDIT